MKVDFTKFPLFTGIDRQDMVIADIRKDIADGIYRNVPGLPGTCLRRRSIGTSLWSLPMTRFIYLTSTLPLRWGSSPTHGRIIRKTIWKLVNKKYYGKDGIK